MCRGKGIRRGGEELGENRSGETIFCVKCVDSTLDRFNVGSIQRRFDVESTPNRRGINVESSYARTLLST